MKTRAKTKEDKKREILEYLEENSQRGDILSLSRKKLLREFKDSHYSEESIDEVVKELIEEEPVSKNQVEIETVYTDKHKGELLGDFEERSQTPLKGVLIMGYYLFFFSVISMDFFNSLLYGLNNAQILGAGLIGVLFTVASGKLAIRVMDSVEEKIPVIREHKQLIYPTLGIFFIAIAIAAVASAYYETTIPITALVSVPGTSVLGGVAVARYWDNIYNQQ